MLLSCGDALIDFLPATDADGRDAVMPAVGGSCLNVAIGMARLGAPTGFVGGISTDLFGRMIADHAAASQCRSSRSPPAATTRPRSPSFAPSPANRTTLSTTPRHGDRGIGPIGSGSIPFDRSKRSMSARRRSSTTRRRPSHRPGRRSARRRLDHLLRSELPAQPRGDKPAYLDRMAEFAAAPISSGCPTSTLTYLFGDEPYPRARARCSQAGASLVVITRGDNGAIAWHARAGQIEVSRAQGRGRRHHRRRRQFSGGVVVRPAQAGTSSARQH